MAATIWQLLFVDDDPDFCRQVQEFLDGEIIPPDDRMQVKALNDFGDALNPMFKGLSYRSDNFATKRGISFCARYRWHKNRTSLFKM